MENSYKCFKNKDCQYYPCHDIKEINCMFCFCPLYRLKCKGNYALIGHNVKDCSNCNLPHTEEGYDYIIKMLKERPW